MKSVLKFAKVAVVVLAIWTLSACSETADTGVPVSIPSIRVQCTDPICQPNTTSVTALTSIVFTTSGCVAPDFGETLRYVSTSHTCTRTGGCNFSTSSGAWVEKSGAAASTIPSGTYSVCGCIHLSQNSIPFQNCDAESSYGPILIDSSSGQLPLTSWN